MRTRSKIALLAILLCSAAIVASQPQSEAVMIIAGIPGEIPISLEGTDWSQFQGMPDPRTPQRSEIDTLGSRSANPLTSRESSSSRDSGRAGMQDVSVTKNVDRSSHALLDACASGQRMPEVRLEIRPVGGQRQDLLVIKMRNVVITRVDEQPAQPTLRGGRATEAVTLRCESLEWEIQRAETAWRPSTPAYPITPRPR
jgi:type VI secretion system Hcp family effector